MCYGSLNRPRTTGAYWIKQLLLHEGFCSALMVQDFDDVQVRKQSARQVGSWQPSSDYPPVPWGGIGSEPCFRKATLSWVWKMKDSERSLEEGTVKASGARRLRKWGVSCHPIEHPRTVFQGKSEFDSVRKQFWQPEDAGCTLIPAFRSISRVGRTSACSWSSTPVRHNSSISLSRLSTTAATFRVRSWMLSLAWLYRLWGKKE